MVANDQPTDRKRSPAKAAIGRSKHFVCFGVGFAFGASVSVQLLRGASLEGASLTPAEPG